MGMQLITRQDGGHVVAGLSGELDAVNAADGAAAIVAVMTPGRCLIADLAALEFIDCCALGALLAVRTLARQEGGDLLLAAPAGSVRRLLALTGWDGVFSVHASVAAAAASITEAVYPRVKQGRGHQSQRTDGARLLAGSDPGDGRWQTC